MIVTVLMGTPVNRFVPEIPRGCRVGHLAKRLSIVPGV